MCYLLIFLITKFCTMGIFFLSCVISISDFRVWYFHVCILWPVDGHLLRKEPPFLDSLYQVKSTRSFRKESHCIPHQQKHFFLCFSQQPGSSDCVCSVWLLVHCKLGHHILFTGSGHDLITFSNSVVCVSVRECQCAWVSVCLSEYVWMFVRVTFTYSYSIKQSTPLSLFFLTITNHIQNSYHCFSPGGISILWACMWWYNVYSTPDEHPRISTQEKSYIKKSLARTQHDKQV